MGGGREAQKGGDICILIADTHCCTAETNNIVKQVPYLKKNTLNTINNFF